MDVRQPVSRRRFFGGVAATVGAMSLTTSDLFAQATICDYLFDKDKIFAYLNLDDNELFIYQRLFDLLARDVDGVLLNQMNTTVDGEFQKFAVESGAYIRENFFGPDPRLQQMVAHLTDHDLETLPRGGHDYRKLYAAYKESLEKRSMGFQMTAWDSKLLKYGEAFERKMMDLSVNMSLEAALDAGWAILAECFRPEETGLRTDLIAKFWPK